MCVKMRDFLALVQLVACSGDVALEGEMVLHKPLLDVPQTNLGYSLTRISRSVLSVDASNDSNAAVLRANRTPQTLLTNLGYPCCERFQMYKSEELWAKTCVRVEIVCCDRNVGKLVARCMTSHFSRCLSSGRCYVPTRHCSQVVDLPLTFNYCRG
jgi:hypothetical protein